MTGYSRRELGQLDPLYLFFCRVRYLRLGDLCAYEELERAAAHSNPDIRLVARTFLSEIDTTQAQRAADLEGLSATCQCNATSMPRLPSQQQALIFARNDAGAIVLSLESSDI